jgi:hypothetical protein
MFPNYKGRSPFFCACKRQNMEIMTLFECWKHKAVLDRDYLGENMLFVCARQGNVDMFKWFYGSDSFFKARGM